MIVQFFDSTIFLRNAESAKNIYTFRKRKICINTSILNLSRNHETKQFTFGLINFMRSYQIGGHQRPDM